MAKQKEWFAWLKCNILEIIILILVLVLVIKAFSGPVSKEISAVQVIEEPVGISEGATNVAEEVNLTTEEIKTNETTEAEETNNESIKK